MFADVVHNNNMQAMALASEVLRQTIPTLSASLLM
jgi:hypothetical protein